MLNDLLGLSNLFNTITQSIPKLKSYHFGIESDINRNIANNYDPLQQCGKQFPHVHFIPPFQNEYDVKTGDNIINVNLYFYDLQHYNNDSTRKTATLLEQWQSLLNVAFVFLSNVKNSQVQHGFSILNHKINWDLGQNVHNDRLIVVELNFRVVIKTPCDKVVVDDLEDECSTNDMQQ